MKESRRIAIQAYGCLTCATALWGLNGHWVKISLFIVSDTAFIVIRFLLAAIICAGFAFALRRMAARHAANGRWKQEDVIAMVISGALMWAIYLPSTRAFALGDSLLATAFLAGGALLIPVASLMIRSTPYGARIVKQPNRITTSNVVGVAIAILGVYCLWDGSEFVNSAAVWGLMSAIAIAFELSFVTGATRGMSIGQLAEWHAVAFLTCGILAAGVYLLMPGVFSKTPADAPTWAISGYGSVLQIVLSAGLGTVAPFLLSTWATAQGQQDRPAVTAVSRAIFENIDPVSVYVAWHLFYNWIPQGQKSYSGLILLLAGLFFSELNIAARIRNVCTRTRPPIQNNEH